MCRRGGVPEVPKAPFPMYRICVSEVPKETPTLIWGVWSQAVLWQRRQRLSGDATSLSHAGSVRAASGFVIRRRPHHLISGSTKGKVVTTIPRPAGKRRWTMGPICLGGSEPWAGAVTHRPSTQNGSVSPDRLHGNDQAGFNTAPCGTIPEVT
jgi:hypothetical protein